MTHFVLVLISLLNLDFFFGILRCVFVRRFYMFFGDDRDKNSLLTILAHTLYTLSFAFPLCLCLPVVFSTNAHYAFAVFVFKP